VGIIGAQQYKTILVHWSYRAWKKSASFDETRE